MANHNLIEKVKSRIYKTMAVGALTLGGFFGYGCGDNGVEPGVPSVSQSAQLVDDINIRYTASLRNVNSASRKILYNGNLLETKTITGPSYSETLEGKAKGDYMFVATASGADPDTARTNVPNYGPEKTQGASSASERDITPGSQTTINLEEAFFDRNPEDNPVPIASVRVLKGDVEASLNGYDLTIKSMGGAGEYEVEVTVGSDAGRFENFTYGGNVTGPQRRLAFLSNRDEGTGEIYVGDLIKTVAGRDTLINTKRVTNNNNNDTGPAWSPDGKYLVWSANRARADGWFALYKVNPDETDGDDETRITPLIDGFSAYAPVWCNNGWIYFNFLDRNSGTQGIARTNPDGSNLETIIEEPFYGRVSGRSACSPDGSQIAYVSRIDGNNPEIYVSDSVGNNQRNITNNPAEDFLPFWSSDGDIFFRSNRNGSTNIYRTNSNGTEVVQFTDESGQVTDPAVSPDGTLLAFAYDLSLPNPHIFVMKSDGTGEWTQLTFDASRYPVLGRRQ